MNQREIIIEDIIKESLDRFIVPDPNRNSYMCYQDNVKCNEMHPQEVFIWSGVPEVVFMPCKYDELTEREPDYPYQPRFYWKDCLKKSTIVACVFNHFPKIEYHTINGYDMKLQKPTSYIIDDCGYWKTSSIIDLETCMYEYSHMVFMCPEHFKKYSKAGAII